MNPQRNNIKQLLRIKTGYSQHATTNFPNTTPLLNVLVRLKNNNKSDYTIKAVAKSLRHIAKHADLNNPEAVKQFIANKNVTDGTKKNLIFAYDKYCEYYKIQFEKPIYKGEAKQIRIPTNEKLEKLIASSGRVLSIKLRLSKETGLRPVELCNLRNLQPSFLCVP